MSESLNLETAGTVYRFESFELDPGLYVLRRGGTNLDVQPKVLDLLLYLVARRDRVVTKEEILDALWPGVAATDDVLSRAIHAARQAVGDDGDQQSIIQTVRRRGFRFVAAVDTSEAAQAAPARAIATPRPSRQEPWFVGRQREIQRLDESLEEANQGHGRIVFISAEAGGGKTRLLEEFVRRAASTATVYSGWCWEGEGARSYWPWVQILRALIAARSPERLREQMGSLALDIARIIPSLREKLPELPDSPAVQSDKERFRLFDSVTCFLRRVATDDGTQILVLDDLQWADAPSLRLIDFLAHEMVDAPILLLGAYREETIGQPLLETLGVLARRSLFEQLNLKGLASTEIAQLLRLDGNGEPSEDLVTAVAEKTDGNPFLVAELAQLIKSQPSAFKTGVRGAGSFSLPQGMTAVVQRRLAMLRPEAHKVLAVAAVIGQEFSREVLVQSLDPELRLGPLDEALRSNIVTEVPHALGRYRFTHALVSEALYEEIEISERARIHRRVAGVLERMQGMSPTSNLAEIAFHYTHGVSPDDFEKAIVFARRTGERAVEQLAWEEASTHFRDALKLLEQREARTANERCQLLLATAEAERRAGNLSRAREAFAGAADLARRFELPEILGRAALGVQTPWDILSGSVDEVEVALLEDALRFHTDPQSLTRARLLGRLAIATYWNNDSERGLALTEEAIGIARNSGDPSALAQAMIAQLHVITRPFFIERQVPLLNEIVRLAYESGDPNLIFTALFYRSEDLLVCGDIRGIDRDFAEISRLAEQLRQPPERSFVKIVRATRLLFEGHVAESAAISREALDFGTLGVDLDYQLTRTLLRFGVFYERLTLDALEDEVRFLAESHPAGSMWFCALADLCSQIGKHAEARNLFESLAIKKFSTVSPDYGWEVSLHHLAELCVRLRDSESAAVLYRQLLPHDGRFAALSWITFCGPISRYLALLAPLAGRDREAIGHFEAAIDSCERLGARLWTARLLCDYSRFLIQRGSRGDRDRALELRERAMIEARDLDSPRLKAEIDSIKPS